MQQVTEAKTLFVSTSTIGYYVVTIAEPHMKLVSECTETGLQPCI